MYTAYYLLHTAAALSLTRLRAAGAETRHITTGLPHPAPLPKYPAPAAEMATRHHLPAHSMQPTCHSALACLSYNRLPTAPPVSIRRSTKQALHMFASRRL